MNVENFLPYAKPSLNAADKQEVSKALETYVITRGPTVEAFEKAMADYCQAKYAVAFTNGSAALMAAYFAAQMGPQDKLITTPNTFVATAGAAMLRGVSPIFLDIDRSSGNMDLKQLEHTLSRPLSRGRMCIAPVHFAGIPIDMQKMDQMVRNPDVVIIEDAAHALGSTYATGERIGSCTWSQMTVFSFHPAKTITTGEGGLVTTQDEALYHRLKLYRNNGIESTVPYLEGQEAPGYYEVTDLTGNFNFTEFQAALGLSQLTRLESFIQKRRELIKLYRDLLKGLPHIQMFSESYDPYTAYHLCVVQIDFEAYKITRTALMNKLREKNIGTQVHYIPVYYHPYFKKVCGEISEYFPEMEKYYSQALSLPLYYDLRPEDVEYVVTTLKKVLR
jgi:dTDP-4-amino-4,6-dideoxygalactose transaminase